MITKIVASGSVNFPWIVEIRSGMLFDYSEVDNWCLKVFGPPGQHWTFADNGVQWKFKTYDDAVLCQLTWI